MKAIIYGPAATLQLGDVEKPAPREDEVLVRVRAAGVNPLDGHMLKTAPWFRDLMLGMFGRVKRPGADIAGEVEAVGARVTRFKPGDAVFGSSGGGGFAEFACPPEHKLAIKPANISYEEAAAVNVAARTALQGLRDIADVKAGQKVLINGASGGVGTFAVQIARWLGAEVTAVCSTPNLNFVRELGADHTIDYTRADFLENRERYDVILDLVSNRRLRDLSRGLTKKGKWLGGGVLGVDASMIKMVAGSFNSIVASLYTGQTFKSYVASSKKNDLPEIADLLESGKIRSIIDRTYPLSATAEAVEYVNSKRARGKVVVTI